jgi:hypothetical protein
MIVIRVFNWKIKDKNCELDRKFTFAKDKLGQKYEYVVQFFDV